MMTRQFRDDWVAALLAEDAKQTKGVLERRVFGHVDAANGDPVEGQCCIGVRCNLDVSQGMMTKESSNISRSSAYFEKDHEDKMTTAVCRATLERWGLSAEEQQSLVKMNDELGMSFEAIANYLRTRDVIDEAYEVEVVAD